MRQHPIGGRSKFAADSSLEQSGFEPLVPLATEMRFDLVRGITNPTRMPDERESSRQMLSSGGAVLQGSTSAICLHFRGAALMSEKWTGM
jgi:hypothetical protein